MESEIIVKEIQANLKFSVEEIAKLKMFLEGTLQLSSYLSQVLDQDILSFAEDMDKYVGSIIKSLGE